MIHGMWGQVSGSPELPIPWMWKPETKRLNDILKITHFGGSQQYASELLTLTPGPANLGHTMNSSGLVHCIRTAGNKMAASTHRSLLGNISDVKDMETNHTTISYEKQKVKK